MKENIRKIIFVLALTFCLTSINSAFAQNLGETDSTNIQKIHLRNWSDSTFIVTYVDVWGITHTDTLKPGVTLEKYIKFDDSNRHATKFLMATLTMLYAPEVVWQMWSRGWFGLTELWKIDNWHESKIKKNTQDKNNKEPYLKKDGYW